MGFDNLLYSWTVIFPLAVLLYYFFRKRYEVKTISSILFWEQSMQETKISPYLKNLQRNALFYLQMLALLLFVFMLLGPYFKKEMSVGNHTIFIVDTSASMLAGRQGESLLEQHQRAMLEFAEARVGERMTVITTGIEPQIILREESDEKEIRNTIDALAVTYEHEYMERALELARSIATLNGAEIHIYTDALDRSVFSEEQNNFDWHIHSSDQEFNNVSIQRFGAVQTPEGIEAIVKINNKAPDARSGEVRIVDADSEKVLGNEAFTIENGEDRLISFKELPMSSALYAEMIVEDDYQVDNIAHLILGNETLEAVIDDQLHALVKKAFEAVGLMATSGAMDVLLAAQDTSIVVTNDVSMLGKGTKPIMIIGRNDKQAETVSGVIETADDPLFNVANLGDVYVSELYPPIASYTTIATVGDRPFIQKSNRGDIVILADIEMTDWPLHPSFPLFIWSSTEMLRTEADSLGTFVPLERKAVLTGASEKGMEVYSLNDEYVTTILDGSNFVAPAKPGIYKALDGGSERWMSVQLEDSEKELLHGASYRFGNNDQEEGKEEGKNRFGPYILLPILLLLLIEWEVQRRRGYPN